MTELAHRHTIYIRCKPVELWAALTEGEQTRKWYMASTVESSFEVGAPIRFLADAEDLGDPHAPDPEHGPERVEAVRGHIRALEPERLLVHGFSFADLDELETEVAWTIEALPDSPAVVRVTLAHTGFAAPGETWQRTAVGWPVLLSGLKTWLETHEPLAIASP